MPAPLAASGKPEPTPPRGLVVVPATALTSVLSYEPNQPVKVWVVPGPMALPKCVPVPTPPPLPLLLAVMALPAALILVRVAVVVPGPTVTVRLRVLPVGLRSVLQTKQSPALMAGSESVILLVLPSLLKNNVTMGVTLLALPVWIRP